MEDFKKIVKMKTGGSVKAMCYGGKMKKGGKVENEAAEIKQDKAIVKKAFKLHDKQEHEGEKTDLSTLKRGGRAKKAVGTVKKFDGGGSVLSSVKNAILGTPAQNAAASQAEAKYLKAKRLQRAAGQPMGATEQMAMGLADMGQKMQPAPAPQAAPADSTIPAGQKRGGKVKKGCK